MIAQDFKKISEKNFEILLEHYNNNDKKLLPFLGSGISTPTGISNWVNLLVDLGKLTKKYNNKESLEKMIKELGYPKTASIIKDEINNEDKYKSFLVNQFEPKNTLTTSTIIKIMIKFFSVVTTNYDTTLEEAIKTINFIYSENSISNVEFNTQDLPDLSTSLLLEKKNIVYLHGYKRNKNFLLTENDYRYFYPSNYGGEGSEDLEEFLRSIIKDMNLVFMGFSFKDKDFMKFFKNRIEKIRLNRVRNDTKGYQSKNVENSHFAFIKLKDKGDEEQYKMLNDMNIKPIYYEGNYSNLEDWLHQIKKIEIKDNQGYPDAI
ncbi:hypothetical protein CRV02_13065 [Arcobacter sp. CECT 8989]|uniref:SIR2 family NAD-dependent protein deacylase n=1 Tax=Arcobacter sp. CECT 8989 TaxID=2044509 RepID=UPI00100C1479|nr:SIR2 family protein [Arcobacter sp. CECT 8989]RXJ98675.1 hypothetical protein CRV02_13065 [Arcobacter sp. CECT 8989]